MLTVCISAAQGAAMIPVMLQQGYKALAVTFDVWGVANMVNDGMNEARGIIEKIVDEQKENGAAKEANGAKGENGSANGSTAEVVVGKGSSS